MPVFVSVGESSDGMGHHHAGAQRAIDEHVPDGHYNVLDMGCGHVAVLAYVKKRRGRPALSWAWTIYKDFVRNAASNMKKNWLF